MIRGRREDFSYVCLRMRSPLRERGRKNVGVYCGCEGAGFVVVVFSWGSACVVRLG